MQLRTAFHLARAETRRARGTLLFCVLSVAIGAFAVTSIRSLTSSFDRSLAAQARQILGADLELEGNRPLDGEAARAIEAELRAAGARVADSTRFYSMLARAGEPAPGAAGPEAPKATTLVRVRALADGYPFYGSIDTLPPGQRARLGDAPGVLVDPAVMRELGLAPGSVVRLGELEAVVLGEFVKQAGSPAAEFSLAPYLYLHERFLPATGLLKTGSRVDYERLFALPAGMSPDALKEKYWERALSENLELKTYRESAANVQRFLGRVSRFLTLVGLITLFLGALGVGSAFHAFIRQKLDHAAILRCVGARPRDVLLVYGLLATMIASVGAALGAGLGALAPGLLGPLLARLGQGYLPAELALGPSLPALAHGFVAGLWSALVFTLVPLSAVALVAPLRALGRDVSTAARPTLVRGIALAGIVSALFVVLVITTAQTGSLGVGLWFLAAVCLCLLGLSALAYAGVRLARWLGPRLRGYHLRQGIANLERPANQTRSVVIAVGAGFFLLSTILILRGSLERTLAIESREDMPTLFAIDIQADQHDGVKALFSRYAAEDVELSPMVAARIRALNGRALERSEVERHAGRRTWEDRMRTREYFLSYRDRLVPSEQLTAGQFWSGRPATQEASIDAGLAAGLGIALGDTLTLDIQGLPLDAKVTSFREIRWQAMRPNALILLSPGEIEQAPRMYVGATRIEGQEARYELSRALVSSYPNVSVIDVSDTAATVLGIVARIGTVFTVIGLLATVTGAIILAGAIAAGRYARQRETTLLRVLGASRTDLQRILVAEYLGLALLGTLGGWLLAEVVNRALLPSWFETAAHVPYPLLIPLAIVTILLNTVVGMLVGRRVSRHAPLALLRES